MDDHHNVCGKKNDEKCTENDKEACKVSGKKRFKKLVFLFK